MQTLLRLRSLAATVVLCALWGAAHGQSIIATVQAGTDPRAIAIDSGLNRIFVANETSNDVTSIDGATRATATIPVGRRPQYVAVNPVTHRVYVANALDATMTVIDGRTNAVLATLPVNGSGPILVDERANRIYMIRSGIADEVTIIDGARNTFYTIATLSYSPVSQALNAARDRLYVAHYTTGDVRAVDLTSTSDHPPTVSIGVWSRPVALAMNTATDKVYVIGEDSRGPIAVIDARTNAATFLSPAGHAEGPRAIAVNEATNKVYAAFTNEVIVIDGATNALTFIPSVTAVGLVVDPATHKVYVAGAAGRMTVIDGASNAAFDLAIPAGARAVALDAGTQRVYVAGPAVSVIDASASPPPPPPPVVTNVTVHGLWWATPPDRESGWGLNIAQQGQVLFATWYTYDATGQPMWLVMSNGERIGTDTYSGTLYRVTGPAWSADTFDPSRVVRTPVGTATLSFRTAEIGNFSATVDGVSFSRSISRMVYASPQPLCALGGRPGTLPNYQDLWAKGDESGWGVHVAHQGDTLFLTWFTFSEDGRDAWFVASNMGRTGNNVYSGTLYRTAGPAFNSAPWDETKVTRAPAGTVTLSFSDADRATLSYTIDGTIRSKAISRFVFATPVTTCR